ncbi:phage tail protein, partial [Metapseudomonas otitidis]
WNDPEDGYRKQVEVVEDADAIRLFGWRQLDVTAFGCTSRGQAHRLGRWLLYSERAETDTISYTAGVDHADLRPGDIIALHDPS